MDIARNDIYVIIPAYNEAVVIREVLCLLIDAGYSVVVVDDGSQDDTWREIQRLPIYGLQHPINLGQGAALQTGMTFALQQNARYIVHFDADGQHRLDDIETLLAPLIAGEADMALGSRFLRTDDTRAVPWQKQILLRGAVIINGLLSGFWLTDAHNGLRAMTADAARKIDIRENGFAHASEILMHMQRHKLRYVECPTSIAYTEYSRAKGQPIWNAVDILIDLLLRKFLR